MFGCIAFLQFCSSEFTSESLLFWQHVTNYKKKVVAMLGLPESPNHTSSVAAAVGLVGSHANGSGNGSPGTPCTGNSGGNGSGPGSANNSPKIGPVGVSGLGLGLAPSPIMSPGTPPVTSVTRTPVTPLLRGINNSGGSGNGSSATNTPNPSSFAMSGRASLAVSSPFSLGISSPTPPTTLNTPLTGTSAPHTWASRPNAIPTIGVAAGNSPRQLLHAPRLRDMDNHGATVGTGGHLYATPPSPKPPSPLASPSTPVYGAQSFGSGHIPSLGGPAPASPLITGRRGSTTAAAMTAATIGLTIDPGAPVGFADPIVAQELLAEALALYDTFLVPGCAHEVNLSAPERIAIHQRLNALSNKLSGHHTIVMTPRVVSGPPSPPLPSSSIPIASPRNRTRSARYLSHMDADRFVDSGGDNNNNNGNFIPTLGNGTTVVAISSPNRLGLQPASTATTTTTGGGGHGQANSVVMIDAAELGLELSYCFHDAQLAVMRLLQANSWVRFRSSSRFEAFLKESFLGWTNTQAIFHAPSRPPARISSRAGGATAGNGRGSPNHIISGIGGNGIPSSPVRPFSQIGGGAAGGVDRSQNSPRSKSSSAVQLGTPTHGHAHVHAPPPIRVATVPMATMVTVSSSIPPSQVSHAPPSPALAADWSQL
jgi:hypothetical protein